MSDKIKYLILEKDKSSADCDDKYLTLFRVGLFGAAHVWWVDKNLSSLPTPFLKSVTHIQERRKLRQSTLN